MQGNSGPSQVGVVPLRRPLLLVDRYVLRLMLPWYGAVIGVVVFLLCLETMPRLVATLGALGDGMSLVVRSLASLIPEYVAVALPIALFLATALTVRRLAMAGELDVFAASGLDNRRLLLWPMILGLFSCLLLLGLRGYVQPAGERELDAIGLAVRSGQFGYALDPGVSHQLNRGTSLYFQRVDARSGLLENIIVHHERKIASANSAMLRRSAVSGLILWLNDVTVIWDLDSDRPRVARLRQLRLAIPFAPPRSLPRQSPRDRLDRLSLTQLLHVGTMETRMPDLAAARARASASARIAAALLCCIMPLFGFAHGPPPKRSRSAIGIGVGIVEIILFWRISALIEDRFTAAAPAAHAALVATFAFVALQLARYQQREGFGAVEQVLARMTGIARQLSLLWAPGLRRDIRQAHIG